MLIKKGFNLLILVLSASIILIYSACKKEEPVIEPPSNPLCTIAENPADAKDYLLTKSANNILIIHVEKTAAEYEIDFEDSAVLKFDVDFLDSLETQGATWKAKFMFSDGTNLSVKYLGNTFAVLSENIFWNETGISPLSANISLETLVEGSIHVKVLGKGVNGITIEKQFSNVGIQHEFPVLGLYPDYENQVAITFTNKDGQARISDTISITTPELDLFAPIEILQNNYSEAEKDKLFFLFEQTLVFDTQGEIRWWLDRDLVRTYPTTDGNIVCALTIDRQAWDGEAIHYNMEGEILNEYFIETGLHHEVIQKEAGGNFLIGSSVGGVLPENTFNDDDTEDLILEIDKESGEVVKEWDLTQYFDKERERFWTERPSDWCHLNSIQYDPSDNTLLLSSKLQSFVAKIGYDDGEVKWILGNPANWKMEFQQYLLTPTNFDMSFDEHQDWTYAQHSARTTPKGNIIIYDNGADRPGFDADNIFNKNDGYVRSVEYKVDAQNKTVEKVWDYAHYGTDIYSVAIGSVERLENGNTLEGHGYVSSFEPRVVEIDVDKNIVFEAAVPSLFYRVYLVDLYKGYQ